MNKTTNYNLNKPEGTDFYDIEDHNDNMDIIDEALHDISSGLDTVNERYPVIKLTKSSVSSLPVTITDARLTTKYECIKAVLSNPSAQTGDWTVNTNTSGQATISGSISGTTNITLYMEYTE